MSQPTEEDNKETGRRSASTVSIIALWSKFHFSGRVIMCSVLFGLGLVLIGGLVFAINMDDGSSTPISDDINAIATKPPSKYVGPVIMGIGGFIVTVGIIMCLFETQVCRKKSGDASPLISEKTDPEDNNSAPGPSSSHSNKNHKHRKIPGSPRKSKSKHKSHSKEKGQQKSPSAKTPPVTIDKSKSFMTSSEDTFLTPPNVPSTPLENSNAENPNSESLMKSFTSSAPSLNQSTEFLTPSTSFRDTSISLNSSIEVDERQQQANFKPTDVEFMTPLTVEEDRIQKLLIRVKNEQKEIAKREMEEKMPEIHIDTGTEKGVTAALGVQTEAAKEDNKIIKTAEDKNISTHDLPAASLDDVSGPKDIAQVQKAVLSNVDELRENKTNQESNNILNKCVSINVHPESIVESNDAHQGFSHTLNDIGKEENSPWQNREKQEVPPLSDASKSLIGEEKYDSDRHFNKEISDETNENDLENSVSSDETVVSPDSFVEKARIEEKMESALKEISHINNDPNPENVLESLGGDKSEDDGSEISGISSGETQKAKDESDDISHKESDTKIDEHTKILTKDDSS